MHHELPFEVIPYKRHEAESIEAVLEDKELLDTPADEFTLKRWRKWFAGLTRHLLGVLASAMLKSSSEMDMTPPTGDALQRIRQAVGDAPGWLSRVVQTAVKIIVSIEHLGVSCRIKSYGHGINKRKEICHDHLREKPEIAAQRMKPLLPCCHPAGQATYPVKGANQS